MKRDKCQKKEMEMFAVFKALTLKTKKGVEDTSVKDPSVEDTITLLIVCCLGHWVHCP